MTKTIVLGGGCFWCIEALFQKVNGITSLVSGYAGGSDAHPTYESVCSGTTGHAEVVMVEYDADKIDLGTVLDFFFEAHDPTTLNREGNDAGTQYRSIILYRDESELPVIHEALLRAKEKWEAAPTTEVSKLETFYPAEEYHQNYYNKYPNQPYCAIVIAPKLEKFLKHAKQG